MTSSFYRKFVHPNYRPKRNELVASFYLEANIDFKDAAGGVAAESSIGTWTELETLDSAIFKKLAAKAFSINKKRRAFCVAYPIALLEKGSIPQFLSGIAGNIFSMKIVKNLRLFDVDFPQEYIAGFPGPRFGIKGIRQIMGISDRPLLGCISKPKLGLTAKQHAKLAYQVFLGGIDIVKDDENLTDLPFNHFEKRVKETIRLRKKAEKETGQKKMCVFNITAPPKEMLKRARLVKRWGGKAVMIDIVSVGLDNVQMLRKENLGLILHGHRAGHSMFTKNPKHGMSMLVLAKLSRLAGIDQLHTGTVVGKMEGEKKEILEINKFLRSNWYKIKPVLPIASGGLHPGLIPKLYKIFGKDIIFNFGGGVHGHPQGSFAGAKAVIHAMEATLKKTSLKSFAKNHMELAEAIDYWNN